MSTLSGGVYETTKAEVEPDAASDTQVIVKQWARWGKDNNYPQRLINAVKSDPIAGMLEKKIAFHYGRGLMFYKRVVNNGKEDMLPLTDEEVPKEVLEFMELNDWRNFMHGIVSDYEWWHHYYVQYITNNAGKIIEIKWQRTKDVRPEHRDKLTGKINNYYLSGNWPEPKEGEYALVPAFDKRTARSSGLLKHGGISIDKDYFTDPAWHSITRWLYIASKIPRWILANIDNSMNIKYHVEIPWKYFLDRCPIENYKTEKEQKEAINTLVEETFKKMDDYLAGEKNVHKAFYSFINIMEDGKAAPGWKINVLDNKVQDEAWLRAYGTAAIAMISGVGLSPSIAGSILPNGLGSGSGSDLREQFNFYIQVMTVLPRETTLEPFYLIKRVNQWPAWLHLGYRDIVLQSTDQNKSGYAVTNEQSPTNDSQSKNPVSV